MRRRTFLERIAIVGPIGLAGCIGQPGTETDPTAVGSPTDPPSPTSPPTTAAPTLSPTGAPTDTPIVDDPTPTARAGGTSTATQPPGQTVIVGPSGEFRFEPDTFEVPSGTAVRWIWEAGSHNVKPSTTPDGSDWSGTPGGSLFGAGHSYVETFDVSGTYEYYCSPHRSVGMTGSFTVE